MMWLWQKRAIEIMVNLIVAVRPIWRTRSVASSLASHRQPEGVVLPSDGEEDPGAASGILDPKVVVPSGAERRTRTSAAERSIAPGRGQNQERAS